MTSEPIIEQISESRLRSLISRMSRDIIISGWMPDYIVGITRGGLVPAVIMSHYLKIPMRSLEVSLRDGGACVSDLGMAQDAFGYDYLDTPNPDPSKAKKILIVDDINDSGATINWILQDWPSGCLPDNPRWKSVWNNNVRFAVVVNNLSSGSKVPVDYRGMEIDKSKENLWIEFPWEVI